MTKEQTTNPASWMEQLLERRGRGAKVARARCLADLHARRAEAKGQFFTPTPVVARAWEAVRTAVDGRSVSLFDNSVGVGRMFQFADPALHSLYGCDIDAECVDELTAAAAGSGFERKFIAGGMESTVAAGMDVGLINPPFSLTLQAPTLEPYPTNAFGPFGPGTSASSHVYAVEQALSACQVVAAVLPMTAIGLIENDARLSERLCAVLDVPEDAFILEGARVKTAIAVFDSTPRAEVVRVRWGEVVPDLGLTLHAGHSAPRLSRSHVADEGPAILTPVTGDSSVRVGHCGRRIVLGFACGATEARVLNAIYRDDLPVPKGCDPHRYPDGLRFTGEPLLDLEVHMLADDPETSVRDLIEVVRKAGGEPLVAPGFWQHVRKRSRASARAKTPFRRWILANATSNAERITIRPKKDSPIDPSQWGSPVVLAAQTYRADRAEGGYWTVRLDSADYKLSDDELQSLFNTEGGNDSADWTLLHPGKAVAFPEVASHRRSQLQRSGAAPFVSWDYQSHDVVEASMNPSGAVIAQDPGMGKSRAAVALCLIGGGRRNLIVVEAGLIDEMLIQFQEMGLSQGLYQVITKPAHLDDLKPINLISYERLRSPVRRGAGRRTWASRLRRRISTLVADEADLLANVNSAQARAIAMVSPRRLYGLTGTPIANYPRDMLPLVAATCGDGTAAQPFGRRRHEMTPALLKSAAYCSRGIDAFREKFVTVEWVTHEWKEELNSGAKREVPRIGNLPAFRAWHGPHVLRRTIREPECAKYLPIPDPDVIESTVEFDPGHLAYYLKVAEEFSEWYLRAKSDSLTGRNGLNLVALLARIDAVFFAANAPFAEKEGCPMYLPTTSKERAIVDRVSKRLAEGRKSIVYARSPAVLQRLGRLFSAQGIDSVRFDGTIPPRQRMRSLVNDFRRGPVDLALMSLGVSQKGLNIPEATYIVRANRCWTYKAEKQSADRILRSQQVGDPIIESIHLEGSIDEYMAQMVAHKADATHAGLDWKDPELDGVDFLHLDTLLWRFVEDLAERWGIQENRVARIRQFLTEAQAKAA